MQVYNSLWEIDHPDSVDAGHRSKVNSHSGTKEAKRMLSSGRVVGVDEPLQMGMGFCLLHSN